MTFSMSGYPYNHVKIRVGTFPIT